MKTIIICLFCLTGIFTFFQLNESSKEELQLNKRSILDRESSVKPITLAQTLLKNDIPETLVPRSIETKSKVSSKKENVKAPVSINVMAEQEILNSTITENLEPIENELLKNEITMEQFSVDNTVKSFNVAHQETAIETDGIKVLSAKIEKIETESGLISDEQQKDIISVNFNENSGQSINIENIEPKISAQKPETSFWENKNLNTKQEETSGSILVDDDNTPPAQPENKSELTIIPESIETNIPVNNTETPITEANKIEKPAEDNSMTVINAEDNYQSDENDTGNDQTIEPDENEKIFEVALMSNMNGNHQYAIDLYEKLLEVNPDHKEALYNLAMSKIELNNIKEGCILLNKSLKKGVTQAKDMIYQYCRW